MNSEPSMLGKGWTETEVRHFVGECYDRDTNLDVLLGFSAKYLEKRMILILGKKILQPFMIQGWEAKSPEVLKSVRVPRGEIPTTLGRWDGERYWALFEALKIDLEPQLSVIPIPIGNRTTTMILGVPLDEDSGFEKLAEIAEFVGMQLEKLIRLSKSGELPAKKDRIPASPIRSKTDSNVSNETLQAYVLEATEVDIPIVPKLTEADPDALIRKTLTLGDGLDFTSSSEIEDVSPFRVVSETSEIDDRENEPGSTSNFGLPIVEQISEISFARRSSIHEEDDTKGNTQIAFDSEIDFQPIEPIENQASEPSTGVAIMIPKQVTENSTHATLLGGIGVAADLVEKSLRETVAGPAVVHPRVDLKRGTPGAAIFRARKKSGKVGGFIPQTTKKTPTITEAPPKIEETPILPEASSPIFTESRHTMDLDGFSRGEESEIISEDTNPQLPHNVVSEMKRKLADSEDLEKWDIQDESESLGDWDLDNEDALDPAVFDNLTPTGELTSAAKSIIFESGPLLVENQEYFLMIDSRDKGVAFSAAEKIAGFGKPSLAFLDSIFPGRIFIDRYQFTAQTMPNAASHTPVLACLTQIGTEEALEVPMNYLDDKSTETRFYAVFLLLNFKVGDRINEIYERFFDKDQQIQNVAKLVLGKAKETAGFSSIIDRLRNEIQFSQKDHRVEIACEILGAMKDRQSVELLIDLLEEQKGRVQTRIHNALQVLTLKDWSTPYEWRQWWKDANTEPRSEWLVAALDSNNEFIRKAADKELQQIPGLSLNYHTMQPSKLRRRAQRELRSWFDSLR